VSPLRLRWRNVRIWREPAPVQWMVDNPTNALVPAEIETVQHRYIQEDEVNRVLENAMREIVRLERELRTLKAGLLP
jgi:hypothetical protein